MPANIAAVIHTLNEEANIADCIRSVQSLVAEIIVCDMYSDDRTVEIARGLGARIIFHPRLGFADPAHRFAIEHATQEWILSIDADERMTPPLAARLAQLCAENRYDAIDIPILFEYFGGWVKHGGFFNADYHRFFRRQIYLNQYDPIEEQPHHCFYTINKIANRVTLDKSVYLIHHAYPTIEKYVHKTLGVYGRLEAEMLHKKQVRFSVKQLLYRPAREFVRRYFRWQGYRDGTRGFILCTLYAAFVFIAWANLWALESADARVRND